MINKNLFFFLRDEYGRLPGDFKKEFSSTAVLRKFSLHERTKKNILVKLVKWTIDKKTHLDIIGSS